MRRALGPLLPESIARRPKQPYLAPDSESFLQAAFVQELLSPAALRRSGYFDAAAVGRLVAKCRAGAPVGVGDNMAFVGVLSTQLVDSQVVRRSPAAAAPVPAAVV